MKFLNDQPKESVKLFLFNILCFLFLSPLKSEFLKEFYIFEFFHH